MDTAIKTTTTEPALSRSFAETLQAARGVLEGNEHLVKRRVVDSEAEQIVIAGYRAVCGSGLSRMDLYGRAREAFPSAAGERVMAICGARAGGQPLQYLLGTQVFLDHEYVVSPEVLIPRPETEVLVEKTFSELKSARRRGDPAALGLEIGIGSGIISIELLSRFDGLRMVASELSEGAMRVARGNAERILGEETAAARLWILKAGEARDVWGAFQGTIPPGQADFVISNPPYLASDDPIDADVVDHEPHPALFAPQDDSLYYYRRIGEDPSGLVRKGGLVFVEVPSSRASMIADLFRRQGWQDVEIVPDLTRRDRVVLARKG